MKQLLPLSLLLALQVSVCVAQPASGTETNTVQSSASTGAGAIQNGSSDAEQQIFRDPFAQEQPGQAPANVSDPLEPMNRAFFTFNDKLYFWVLKPVAKGYSVVAPEPMRQSIRRFFVNVRYPVRVVNNMLQAKFDRAGIETARFLINSTVGIGGLFDPAQDEWHLRPHPEDLDQTLGFYGLPTGIYLNWPLFGPSTVRGTVGTAGDSFLGVWNYYLDIPALFYGTRLFDTVNSTSLQLGEYEGLKSSALDPYVALRDAYMQNRRQLVGH